MQQVVAPTHCPSCNSELETVNSILYCRNFSCPAKSAKLVENFGKTLKILGLGPATILKLEVTDILVLYYLSREYYVECLGPALGNKLYDNVQKSTKASLNQVLPALGIPLIGKVAADKICANINHISEITEELANSVLGPKAANNLLLWLEENDYTEYPFSWKSEKRSNSNSSEGSVCITGKLKSFKTKAEAYQALEAKGFTIVESVTKSTKYLVNESGIESAKTEKARANGTIIVNNIKELL